MIFKRLSDFWQAMESGLPSGFQYIVISKVVRLDAKGNLRDILPLSGNQVGTREGQLQCVPYVPRTGGALRPRLFGDGADYTFGKGDAALRHQSYLAALNECAHSTNDASVLLVKRWFDTGGDRSEEVLQEIEDGDVITFEVDGQFPSASQAVKEWWPSYVSTMTAKKGATAKDSGVDPGQKQRCLVTGKPEIIARRMPVKIKGIPKSSPSAPAEVSLIPAEMQSAYSYCLEEAYNSPIGGLTAEAIGNALNYLLASGVHSFRVGKAVYVFWTRASEAFSWDILKDPKPEEVQALLESPFTGKKAATSDSKDFFVLALSANASRIVVRDYHETTLDTVKANLGQWFQRLAIVAPDGSEAKPVGIFRLAVSLFREAKDMPAHVPTALLISAVKGAPLPEYLLGLAVKRNLAMQGPYSLFNKKRYLSVERLSIIKALLSQGEEEDLKGLNLEHPDAAYHCGRLLSVIERIQRAALGDINTTVVDRYYGAACTSPGSVLGNLVNDAQSHLGKLRKDHKDHHHQLRLEQVLTAIGDEFPKTLNLQRQGLFALGFYHQKADDRAQAIKFQELQVPGDTAKGEQV